MLGRRLLVLGREPSRRCLATSASQQLQEAQAMFQQLPEAAEVKQMLQRGAYAQALPLIKRAAEIFSSLPDTSYRVVGQAELAAVLQQAGLWAEEAEVRANALQSVRGAQDAMEMRVLHELSLCELRVGKLRDGLEHSTQALTIARALDSQVLTGDDRAYVEELLIRATLNTGVASFLLGDPAAMAHIDDAIARATAGDTLSSWGQCIKGTIALQLAH